METISLRNKDLTETKEVNEVEAIREVLKSDKDNLYFSSEDDPKHGLSVTIVWGKGKGKDKDKDGGKDQNQGNKESSPEPGPRDRSKEGSGSPSDSDSDRDGQGQSEEEQRGGGEKGEDQNQGQGSTTPGKGGSRDNQPGQSGNHSPGNEGDQGNSQDNRGNKGGQDGKDEEGESGEGVGGDGECKEGSGKERGSGGKGEKEGEGKPKGPGGGKPGPGGSQNQKDQGNSLEDLDIDDILGGSDGPNNQRGGGSDNDNNDGGDYEDDKKRGKGQDKDGEGRNKKGKKTDKDSKGKQTSGDVEEDDDSLESDTSNIDEFPPPSEEEPDPKILDIFFGKSREVEEKENKIIRKSFVFKSGKETLEVFKIEYKNISDSGDRSYIKSLANLVYYLYEPFLKASGTDLDPGEPVIPSPISPQGLRSPNPYERPRISYGAISNVEKVDFQSLIVLVDVSGSMDMDMVRRTVNSYFQSVFYGLKRGNTSQTVNVIVILHGTKAGVFGVRASWKRAGNIIAKVAESSRNLVGLSNGSESTLTHRIEDILKTTDPIPNAMKIIRGQVPILWISDFLWSINVSSQFTRFLSNKPALLISTLANPEEGGSGDVFNEMGHNVALTILRKVPYGALVYSQRLSGVTASSFTPGASLPSGFRLYAKGGAYEQLFSRRDKLGRVSIVKVR